MLIRYKTNVMQAAHIHQPTAWPVPHACAQPYHPGSGSHGQLFRPYWGSLAWHSRRVNEQGKFPCKVTALRFPANSLHKCCVELSLKGVLARTRLSSKGLWYTGIFPVHLPVGYAMLMSPIRAKQLSMAATAQMIWLCACVRYWLGRGLAYVCPLLYVCLSLCLLI